MEAPDVTPRGVYLNLEISPYEYVSPYGEVFKFSSNKKKEIYVRELKALHTSTNKLIEKYNWLGQDFCDVAYRAIEDTIYQRAYESMRIK